MNDEHDAADDAPDNAPSTADRIGQAAGGISGILAGAAVGTAAGPLGVLLGGIAGAIGGWWTGRALVEAAEDIGEADERYYREHFERTGDHPADYDHARGAYLLGDIAAANPEYAGRKFEDVEPDLARGWRRGASEEWEQVRDYARVGFTRRRDRRAEPRPGPNRRAGSRANPQR